MDNLKWQWADLMPGDIIKISKKFEKELKIKSNNDWWIHWINREIRISSLEVDEIEDIIFLETNKGGFDITISSKRKPWDLSQG